MWDAVKNNDIDLIRDILKLKPVKKFLGNKSREQIYYDEEAPLHLAAFSGQNDLIRVLVLEGGLDVDSYNVYSDGSGFKVTPLHFAAYKNKVSTIKCLLLLGADPNLPGKWGKAFGTPRDFARHKKCFEAAAVLETSLKELVQEVDEVTNENQLQIAEAKVRMQMKLLEDAQCELLALKATMGLNEGQDENCLCVQCKEIPRKKIFSCIECDRIFCNSCRLKTSTCGNCNADFERSSPKRNIWAEKYLKVIK